MSDEAFEELVNQALDNLPDENLTNLDNVVIVVEDWPTEYQLKKGEVTRGTLFGLYEGVPKTRRGSGYSFVTPDKITIFKGPLTRAAVNEDHLKHLVNNTVWHEVAHHFGLGHAQIHALERRAQVKKQFGGKIEYITADNLSSHGVKHAWFGRSGGVSAAPFESLNTSFGTHDRPEYVEENLRRACSELNLDRSRLITAGLIHSNKVLVATKEHEGKIVQGTDAIVTNLKDLPISLNTADCLPIFLFDPVKEAIAVIHAGWRGLKNNVIGETVKTMKHEYGSEPRDLAAAIGPAATKNTYEIGDDVAKLFADHYIHHRSGKMYLNLEGIAHDQLIEAGANSIEAHVIDTISDKRFFSYRRDHFTGRNFNVISL